jgi:hypothetical protein
MVHTRQSLYTPHMRLTPSVLALTLALTLTLIPAATEAASPARSTGRPVLLRQSRRTLLQDTREDLRKKTLERKTAAVKLSRTYESTELGVSIRYPKDWVAQQIMEREDNLLLAVMFLSPVTQQGLRRNANLVYEDLASNLSLEDYTRLAIRNEEEVLEGFNLIESARTTVAGNPAQRVLFSASNGALKMRFEQVWFIRNNRAHVWTYADASETFDDSVGIFERMLDSLIVQ